MVRQATVKTDRLNERCMSKQKDRQTYEQTDMIDK